MHFSHVKNDIMARHFILFGMLIASAIGGYLVYQQGWLQVDKSVSITPVSTTPVSITTVDEPDPHGHDHTEGDVLTISTAAFETLGIETKTMRPETYTAPLAIPGQVVEIPGRSSYTIAAPVGGSVKSIEVDTGQLLQPNARLFTMEIVDEPLLSAQVDLLDVLSQIDVAQTELDRLTPLADRGAIPGKMTLDLKYELQKLKGVKSARTQELGARGLGQKQVRMVLEDRVLVNQIDIHLSDLIHGQSQHPFVVESIDVHRGMTIERGTSMARLADHNKLYIRGEAFEEDLPAIYRLKQKNASVEVEFGHSCSSYEDYCSKTRSATIAYVDNHADDASGTFFFYLTIENEIATDSPLASGQTTRQWRFKPGQRVHLTLPLSAMEDQFVLPREAVVEDGVESYVFRQLYGHAHQGETRFERIPVQVVYEDLKTAVIDRHGKIRRGDSIVVGRAYQLYLELQAQSVRTAGGDNHHGHNH